MMSNRICRKQAIFVFWAVRVTMTISCYTAIRNQFRTCLWTIGRIAEIRLKSPFPSQQINSKTAVFILQNGSVSP